MVNLKQLESSVKKRTEPREFSRALTFKGKLVELSGHVVDHHPPAVLRPEPHRSFDEVRHHLVDGVGVGGDVFGLQHPGIQDAADALPLVSHPAKPGWKIRRSGQPQRLLWKRFCCNSHQQN